MKLKKLDKSEKYAVGCASTFVFGILFGWVIFPNILNFMLKREMSLAKGRDIRDMWTTIPFALDFKVYFFNYTNPSEVMNGGKPILKEIGPYFYEEWKKKENLIDIEEEDAIYYNKKDTFIFNKKKSGPGLTGNELITLPHLLVVSTIDKVMKEKPDLLKLVIKAFDGIYGNMESIFTQFKAADLLFDGVIINCNVTEFSPKALCTAMRKEKVFDVIGETHLKFSLFGQKNGTVEETKFKVLRGIKNIMDVGRVVEYNGSNALHTWSGESCNAFQGTDGTIFPPFLTEKDNIEAFSPDICRSLPAWYERKSSYSGIQTNRYVSNFGDLANEPENHCFCDTPQTCPKKGLMDMYKCYGIPMVVSLPHYLNTDESVQKSAIGLKPNVSDHGIYVDFEPISGTPMKAKKRIQLNLVVPHVEKYDIFSNFSNTMLPMFWIEEGLAMNKTFVDMLNNQLFILMRIAYVARWTMVMSGFIGTCIALAIRYKSYFAKFVVSPEPDAAPGKTIRINTLGNQHT